MRIAMCVLAMAGVMMMGRALAGPVIGHLELQWSDPGPVHPGRPGAGATSAPSALFRATLVTGSGERIALDPDQARRAAGDLYALGGRKVAVEFSHAKGAVRGAATRRDVQVIVPADAGGGGRHPWAGKVDAAPQPMVGSRPWLTIACRFADIAHEPLSISFLEEAYDNLPGRLDHYWREVSYGKLDLQGSGVVGWYPLPHPRSHYVGANGADLPALRSDCVAAAPAARVASAFAISLVFNGELDGYAHGGFDCLTWDGVTTCERTTWNPPWSVEELGVLAHEMGHGFGLPHSDNSDGDLDPYDNPWDLMSDIWRNAVDDATYGTRPKHLNILQRDRLGWVDADRKLVLGPDAGPTRVTLDHASLAPSESRHTQMLVLQSTRSADPYLNRVYTVEARRRAGVYEAGLAGDAVIIHAVEGDYSAVARSQDADWPPADVADNEGSMFKPGESWVSPDGLYSVHVESSTGTGFIVVVRTDPRVTGGRGARHRR